MHTITQTEINDCHSYSAICRKLNLPVNGSGLRKVKSLIKEFNLDISHFSEKPWYKSKYETVTKLCPVCDVEFKTQLGHPKEKKVCSYGCSNIHFRSGKRNGQYKHGSHTVNRSTKRRYGGTHRFVCLKHWKHVCAIPGCGWDKVIEVHHVDNNHRNNNKENLIPLCPNHHRLTVTNEYKDEINHLIKDLVDEKWKQTFCD